MNTALSQTVNTSKRKVIYILIDLLKKILNKQNTQNGRLWI